MQAKTCIEPSCSALRIVLALALPWAAHCSEPPSCGDLIAEAAARREAIELAPANRVCLVDSDCQLQDESLSCASGCPQPVAVSQARAADVAAEIRNIEAEICREYRAGDCSNPIVPCEPPEGHFIAVCEKGECNTRYSPIPLPGPE